MSVELKSIKFTPDSTDVTIKPQPDTTDVTIKPNLDTANGTIKPNLDTTNGTIKPNLDTTNGTIKPHLDTTDGTIKPNLDTTDGTIKPNLDTADGTIKPNLDTADGDLGKTNPGFPLSTDSVVDGRQDYYDDIKTGEDHPDDSDDVNSYNMSSRFILNLQSSVVQFWTKNCTWLLRVFYVVLFLLYIAYFIYAMYYKFGDEGSYRLVGYTVLGAFLLFTHFCWRFISPYTSKLSEAINSTDNTRTVRIVRWFWYITAMVITIVTIIIYVAMVTPANLVSLAGLLAFMFITFISSIEPAKVKWRPVFWGLMIQYYFALFILKTVAGRDIFLWLGNRAGEFLSFANAGSKFVFGKLYYLHFAFRIFPIITYVSTFIAVLYHLGIMQLIIKRLGQFLTFCLHTTPAESISAAGNIFLSALESPLLVKPFIPDMTKSEIHAVMTGGLSTMTGSVLGAFISIGIPANHLISASVMSAPAALAVAKLSYPELEKSKQSKADYDTNIHEKKSNIVEALSAGASQSIGVISNLAVHFIAYMSIIALFNASLQWAAQRVGIEGLTFEVLCSYLLFPASVLMGADLVDCAKIAELVGLKIFSFAVNSYVVFSVMLKNKPIFDDYLSIHNSTDSWQWTGSDIYLQHWNQTLKGGVLFSARSEVIANYALCGFSNFGSMGAMIAILTTLAPTRTGDITSLAYRSIFCGNIACFVTACMAGLLYDENTA